VAKGSVRLSILTTGMGSLPLGLSAVAVAPLLVAYSLQQHKPARGDILVCQSVSGGSSSSLTLARAYLLPGCRFERRGALLINLGALQYSLERLSIAADRKWEQILIAMRIPGCRQGTARACYCNNITFTADQAAGSFLRE